jgi:SAM-dependent methyltransferase
VETDEPECARSLGQTRPVSNQGEKDRDNYRDHARNLLADPTNEVAFAQAIGAASIEEFHRIGRMEADLLFQYGLNDSSYLIDVGCGSGRLSTALAARFAGRYLGTDISQELLTIAAQITNRPDFAFVQVHGLTVPENNEVADMACLFSVLTHLRHEESYLYLEDIKRCLKPGGQIVFSFLDFRERAHWPPFVLAVDEARKGSSYHVNQFMSHDTIEAFAEMLNMDLVAIHDGSTPYIVNSDQSDPVAPWELVSFGQSSCVLRKR